MKKASIAIVHPQLFAGGGSECVAMWTIQSLYDMYDVTLITMGSVNLAQLNAFYGTSLTEEKIKIRVLPYVKWVSRFDALRTYPLSRFAKKHASDFDLMISTYNIMDFGRKGIQFIADFSFDDQLRRRFDPLSGRKASLLRTLYLWGGRRLAGTRKKGWKKNSTVANSHWTASIMKEAHELSSQVIYPPVVGDIPHQAWDRRKNSFVMLGRISPEKRIEDVIDILQRVRRTNPALTLHIIGKARDKAYGSLIERLCQENKDWCFLEGLLDNQKKFEVISQYRYGISGRPHEPFGIAVAEMAKAGCIVFVPEGGGQTEIVHQPELRYQGIDEAVEKINKVLSSEHLQAQLQKSLAEGLGRFSLDNFINSVRELVETCQKTRF